MAATLFCRYFGVKLKSSSDLSSMDFEKGARSEITDHLHSFEKVLQLAKSFYQVPFAYIAIRDDSASWVLFGDSFKFSAQNPFFQRAISTAAVCMDEFNIAITIVGEQGQVLAVFCIPDCHSRNVGKLEIQMLECFADQIKTILLLYRQEIFIRSQDEMINQNSRLATLGIKTTEILHEINNPLAVLQARLSFMALQMKKEDFTGEMAVEALEKLLITTNRISEIISSVKSFARNIDHDSFEQASVAQILDHSLSFCMDRLKAASVKILMEPISESLVINCRKVQISQVLVNLLSNAIDATEDLLDRWIRISVNELNDTIQIRVIDCGNGIDSKVLEKLFQPFFSTKLKAQGTGLGLSISKKIMESHQGTLQYEKSDGHTCFVLELPKV